MPASLEAGAPGAAHVAVGRVLRPHGIRGELAVESWSDNPSRFAPGSRLLAGDGQVLVVEHCRPHKGQLLIIFAGVENRDQALLLRGRHLAVDRDSVESLPEGTYYYFELIGCCVVDEALGDLGRVVGVIDGGGGELLEVEPLDETREEGKSVSRLLIPWVRSYLTSVDIAARQIRCRLPEGLVEACVSKF